MGQQVIEELQVADAEVRQAVIVDRDAAADPAEGVVVRAEVVQGAGAAAALDGGQQPQGDGDVRIARGPAGVAVDGAKGGPQGG